MWTSRTSRLLMQEIRSDGRRPKASKRKTSAPASDWVTRLKCRPLTYLKTIQLARQLYLVVVVGAEDKGPRREEFATHKAMCNHECQYINVTTVEIPLCMLETKL